VIFLPPWLQALILGVVQGLTEFIPVSSSGHLVLLPYLAGWESPTVAFNVALHVGTLLAVVVFFRTELVRMAAGLVGIDRSPDGRLYRRLALLLVAASVPVAIVGVFANSLVEDAFASPLAASGFLVVTAALLFVAEWWRSRRVRAVRAQRSRAEANEEPVWTGDWVGGDTAVITVPGHTLPTGEDSADPRGASLPRLGLRSALTVGAVQVLALFPGISRSGATISAGLGAGLTREAATRFAFLLGLPALVGAAVFELPDLGTGGEAYSGLNAGIGVVAAFVAGYAAIRYLLRLVARDRLTGFAKYCLVAAAVGFVGYLVTGPPA
jgi:undecaprenyl-diphosphatase